MDKTNNAPGSSPGKEETTFRIGTRGSALARWQSETVASRLDVPTELHIIKTSGDRFQDIPLQGQSQTGFFTKEIENQLLSKEVDLAVHSLKDLPTQPHQELDLPAYLPRDAVSDILIIHPDWHDPDSIVPVKEGCKVGATSLRRQALLRLYAPHAEPTMLRGNVTTRVDKCKDGQYGAIILARAGVERLDLDLTPLIVYRLTPEIWLPAPGQGVIAVQTRYNHEELIPAVQKLNHEPTRNAVTIERKLLSNFEGGCHTAFGAYAQHSAKENIWNAWVGLEIPGRGWVQNVCRHCNMEGLMELKPSEKFLAEFSAIKVEKQEHLCRKLQW